MQRDGDLKILISVFWVSYFLHSTDYWVSGGLRNAVSWGTGWLWGGGGGLGIGCLYNGNLG